MKAYRFEIYTLHPLTKDEGWDIRFRYVLAESRKEAEKQIKNTPFFDCIVSFNFSVELDELDSKTAFYLINEGYADEELEN